MAEILERLECQKERTEAEIDFHIDMEHERESIIRCLKATNAHPRSKIQRTDIDYEAETKLMKQHAVSKLRNAKLHDQRLIAQRTTTDVRATAIDLLENTHCATLASLLQKMQNWAEVESEVKMQIASYQHEYEESMKKRVHYRKQLEQLEHAQAGSAYLDAHHAILDSTGEAPVTILGEAEVVATRDWDEELRSAMVMQTKRKEEQMESETMIRQMQFAIYNLSIILGIPSKLKKTRALKMEGALGMPKFKGQGMNYAPVAGTYDDISTSDEGPNPNMFIPVDELLRSNNLSELLTHQNHFLQKNDMTFGTTTRESFLEPDNSGFHQNASQKSHISRRGVLDNGLSIPAQNPTFPVDLRPDELLRLTKICEDRVGTILDLLQMEEAGVTQYKQAKLKAKLAETNASRYLLSVLPFSNCGPNSAISTYYSHFL